MKSLQDARGEKKRHLLLLFCPWAAGVHGGALLFVQGWGESARKWEMCEKAASVIDLASNGMTAMTTR